MSGKLTKTMIDRVEPKADDYFLWDSELKGFGVKVAKGGRKSFTYISEPTRQAENSYAALRHKKKTYLSLIHISHPTLLTPLSYTVFRFQRHNTRHSHHSEQ